MSPPAWGQSVWCCNFSCSASALLHPCLRRGLSTKLSRSVCSWSASVLLAFLMGILRLLSCKFGAHFVFFGASIGSSCLSFGSSSDQCLWLWELLQRRVLSSFMGVREKQMKKCNICQILSSELLLSDIYSCTCLMLILFCLAGPFFRKVFVKKVEFSEIRHLCSATRIICVGICVYDSLLLHWDWFLVLCVFWSPILVEAVRRKGAVVVSEVGCSPLVSWIRYNTLFLIWHCSATQIGTLGRLLKKTGILG